MLGWRGRFVGGSKGGSGCGEVEVYLLLDSLEIAQEHYPQRFLLDLKVAVALYTLTPCAPRGNPSDRGVDIQ